MSDAFFQCSQLQLLLKYEKQKYCISNNESVKPLAPWWRSFGYPAVLNKKKEFQWIFGFISCLKCCHTASYGLKTGTIWKILSLIFLATGICFVKKWKFFSKIQCREKLRNHFLVSNCFIPFCLCQQSRVLKFIVFCKNKYAVEFLNISWQVGEKNICLNRLNHFLAPIVFFLSACVNSQAWWSLLYSVKTNVLYSNMQLNFRISVGKFERKNICWNRLIFGSEKL